MNPTHAQNAQNPGNYSDEISIKKQYIEHFIDQSSMSTTARMYRAEIQDQTLESSGASNEFFYIQIKELQPGINHSN
jgi:sucrose-6-phosphate hydrolase SacC (GH32 family)